MPQQTSTRGSSAPLHASYESALKDSAFVRSLLDIADDCVALLSLDGRLEVISPRGLDILQIEDFGRFAGRQWLDFWQGPHLADAEAALNAARAGRVGKFQGYADTMPGATKFWDIRVSPIMGDDGAPKALAAISRDMTLLKELEAQRDESLVEMRHRAKNALTIVQAIAQQTLIML